MNDADKALSLVDNVPVGIGLDLTTNTGGNSGAFRALHARSPKALGGWSRVAPYSRMPACRITPAQPQFGIGRTAKSVLTYLTLASTTQFLAGLRGAHVLLNSGSYMHALRQKIS